MANSSWIAQVSLRTLAVLSLVALSLVAAGAQPLLSAVNNPAPVDAAWVVTGEGFDAQTEFYLWTPSLHVDRRGQEIPPAQWLTWLSQPLRLPASAPAGALRLKVLTWEAQLAALEVPAVLPGWGLGERAYQGKFTGLLYAKSAAGWSQPLLVNRPEIFFLRPSRVAPGDAVRVIGRNFTSQREDGQGFVVLRSKETGQLTVPLRLGHYAHGSEGGLEDVQRWVQVPADLAPGDYEALVCNRSGGRLGWSEPAPLQVVAPVSPTPDLLIRLADRGAGDQTPDLTDLLLAALHDAEAAVKPDPARKVVILLPPGRFTLTHVFDAKFPVTLRGAGMDTTTLVGQAVPGQQSWLRAGFTGGSGLVLEDLALVGLPVQLAYPRPSGLVEDAALHRVRTDSAVSGEAMKNLEITGCDFRGASYTWFKNMEDSDLSFNTNEIPQLLTGAGGLAFRQAMQRCVAEFNVQHGPRGFITHKWLERGHVHNLFYCNRAEDTQTWDGEGFLVEGAGLTYAADVVEAGAASVTLSCGEFKDGQLTGKALLLTGGRGLGQYRLVAGNTGRQVTLEQPWSVVPDANSHMILTGGLIENIYAANEITNSFGGGPLLFYAAGMGNQFFGNRSFDSTWMYLWSQAEELKLNGQDTVVALPDYWNTFSDNLLVGQGLFFFEFSDPMPSSRLLPQTLQLGNILRGNTLLRSLERRDAPDTQGAINFSHSPYRKYMTEKLTGADPREAAYWFNVVDSNRIGDCPVGIYVGERAYKAILRNNRFEQVPEPLRDHGMSTVVVGGPPPVP